jgi:vacuolar-type H+-ATPase subunit D/Vma8
VADIDEIVEELKQKRDELRVQIHLASKEVKDEWEELEEKMEDFSGKARQIADDAKLKETGEGIGDALSQLGSELKRGYERIRNAMQD